MCGFAGEFLFPSGRADPACARRMADALVHRGPDESACFVSPDGRCAIGFQRLAVIDPRGSRQPMSLPEESLTVAFNGEIYNYQDLRRQLAGDGATFGSDGDTEVLLHLYARYGRAMVQHLDGMFALAIYDAAAQRLFLARDRLGQKPLWYARTDDRIIFASEAKALLRHPNVGRRINFQALTTYAVTGYVPSPCSAWQGIHKLLPANRLEIMDSHASPERYWVPSRRDGDGVKGDITDIVRSGLTRAVEARMVADVPIGALLSGGVDSAVVVALMARAAGRAGGVRTFTAGFDDRRYDERPAARLVADYCGADHTELEIRPDPHGMLDALVRMYDEPFGDSSALPTFLICQAARQYVTVALAGDGGDEVFAGYDRYRAMHLAQTMRPPAYLAARIAAALARPFAPHDERNRLRRFIRFVEGFAYPFSTQYLKYRALFDPEDLQRLFTDEILASVDVDGPGRWFCNLYEQGDFTSEVARAQHHDLMTYLPDDLLVKTDIASMASSLELRAPMLDHRVVETGLSLPVEAKLSRGRGKAILAEAFGDILPPNVFSAPKRGFSVPLARWLREDLRETMCETLLEGPLLDRGVCRREALVGLINDHLKGRDDHQHRLWALMILARWLAEQG